MLQHNKVLLFGHDSVMLKHNLLGEFTIRHHRADQFINLGKG
jgi:hypothetical protein